MKLPIITIKKIRKIKHNNFTNNDLLKEVNNIDKKKYYLNYFNFPNNNISSILSTKKSKFELFNNNQQGSHRIRTQRHYHYNNNNNNSKKTFYKEKEIENEIINNYQYEKYIKNTLSSFKIKKEISSFLYSSPDKQQRFINILSNKFNNNTSNKNENNNKMVKIRRRFIKLKQTSLEKNENKENKLDNEKDEDKINLKEFSLFSLFIGNKNKIKNKKIHNKMNFMRNNNNIECWDNNLLKNILPQNFKSFQTNNNNITNSDEIQYSSGLNTLNINNNKIYNYNSNNMKYKYKYKYNFECDVLNNKNINNLILYTKRLTRSSSNSNF